MLHDLMPMAVPVPGVDPPPFPPELTHKLHQLFHLAMWGFTGLVLLGVAYAGARLWWSYRTGHDAYEAHLLWRWTLAGSALAVLGIGAAAVLLP